MLTSEQLSDLRAWCFGDPTAASFFVSPGNAAALHAYINGASGVSVWRTDAPVDRILDALDTTKYTPQAKITASDVEPLLTRKRGWMDEVNVKLMLLQTLTFGRQALNASLPNVRASLRDCVIQLPTGALVDGAPALSSAGGASGATVLTACVRAGTRAEIALAADSLPSDQTGNVTARVMIFEGEVIEAEAVSLIYRDDGTIWTP